MEGERRGALGDDPEQGGDLALGGARVGPSPARLEPGPPPALPGTHGAAAPQLGVGEAMEVVALLADGEVELGRVVLAALEGAEAVEGEWLSELAPWPELFVEQQALAADAGREAHDGLGRDAELAGDLAEPGAADQPVRHGEQEPGLLQPVVAAEGLGGEVTPAVTALEPLNPVGCGVPAEEAGADPGPRTGCRVMVCTGRVGAEGGPEPRGRDRHAAGSPQVPCPLQSNEHNASIWSRPDERPGRPPRPYRQRTSTRS